MPLQQSTKPFLNKIIISGALRQCKIFLGESIFQSWEKIENSLHKFLFFNEQADR